MTDFISTPNGPSLLGQLLRVLRTATLERMVLPEVAGTEIDERILMDSHLVRTPPMLFAAQKPTML